MGPHALDVGPPSIYAASEASSTASRQGLSLDKALHNLQKAIAKVKLGAPEQKDEMQIKYEIKSMSDFSRNLKEKCEKHEAVTGVKTHLSVLIEPSLDKAENFGLFASMRLDQMTKLKEEDKQNAQQQPKLPYKIFTEGLSQWSNFQENQGQLYKFFEGNPSQQLLQL